MTDSEYLTGEEILKRWPWLNPEIKAGAYRAKDGWFSAHEVTQGFARAAEHARFYVRTRATGIETDAQGGLCRPHRPGPYQHPCGGQCRRALCHHRGQMGGGWICPSTRCAGSAFLWPPIPRFPKMRL